MNPNQRFSILTFPQFHDGAELALNIVVLPRDQNPLSEAIEQHPTIADAPPFADAQLSFTASVFDGLSAFPHNHPPIQGIPLPVASPSNSRPIFEALAGQPQRRPGSPSVGTQAAACASARVHRQEVPAAQLSRRLSFHDAAPRQRRD
jgi:hypothetical protein